MRTLNPAMKFVTLLCVTFVLASAESGGVRPLHGSSAGVKGSPEDPGTSDAAHFAGSYGDVLYRLPVFG